MTATGLSLAIFLAIYEEPYTTVDVISDPTWRNHTVRQACGHYSANRETVPVMNVGHRDGVLDDSRQGVVFTSCTMELSLRAVFSNSSSA